MLVFIGVFFTSFSAPLIEAIEIFIYVSHGNKQSEVTALKTLNHICLMLNNDRLIMLFCIIKKQKSVLCFYSLIQGDI